MDREEAIRDLHTEVEALIRLHRHGLYGSGGYKARRKRMEALIEEYDIDIKKVLDPVTLILYRRYLS